MPRTSPRPFRIAVPEHLLQDLRDRLGRTHFPGPIAGGGWDYGTDLAYMRDLVTYWQERYDWRFAETALNRMPQFMATVEGVDLHFVHVKARDSRPLPLLFSHGWPGSFWEVHRILGPLTDPEGYGGDPADAFDVVAPSLPGYGFSEDPGRRGMSPRTIARLFAALMTQVLGYSRFGAQGGDWGATITSWLGREHAGAVAGIHLNLIGARPHTGEGAPPLTDAEQTFIADVREWLQAEGGYQHIQGTKPQTLAFSLNDSPAGLAAWIIEKFRAWSDCGGDVESRFSKDDLLTNVMIYWVTRSIGSSVRLYAEARREFGPQLGPAERIEVPTAFARFPAEVTKAPREWVERAYNLQRWSEFPRGGHFAALEEPELLVDDIRAFFRPLRR